jgi:UDP-N-acetyl-D-galactosamine dehydrogenase
MNDSMGQYVASEVIKLMLKHDVKVKNAKILVLGITFKENCPDVRNTKVVDVIKHLKDYRTNVTIYDPWVKPSDVKKEYGLLTYEKLPKDKFDAIVLAVAHNQFIELELEDLKNEKAVVYDVKGILNNKAEAKL